MLIKKRDGQLQDYNLEKISIAISGAFGDFNEEFDDVEVLDLIENKIYSLPSPVDIETIQDIVEDTLLDCGYRAEAKSYARYRLVHEIKRYQTLDNEIEEKLLAKNIENQNANVDEKSFGGRMGEANDIMTKNYALNHCVSRMARDNHLNNEIYIHDLSHYAVGDHNCLSIPFDDLLANGFNTRQTDVRPANSVNTAFQLVAVIFQLQSLQQFGGTSATHIDWTMVPYVRKSFYKHFLDGVRYLEDDKEVDSGINNTLSIEDELYKQYEKAYKYAMDMTEKETHQAVEGMFHNLEIWAQ
jgi:ribonucleoside-triphosphate reductase